MICDPLTPPGRSKPARRILHHVPQCGLFGPDRGSSKDNVGRNAPSGPRRCMRGKAFPWGSAAPTLGQASPPTGSPANGHRTECHLVRGSAGDGVRVQPEPATARPARADPRSQSTPWWRSPEGPRTALKRRAGRPARRPPTRTRQHHGRPSRSSRPRSAPAPPQPWVATLDLRKPVFGIADASPSPRAVAAGDSDRVCLAAIIAAGCLAGRALVAKPVAGANGVMGVYMKTTLVPTVGGLQGTRAGQGETPLRDVGRTNFPVRARSSAGPASWALSAHGGRSDRGRRQRRSAE